MFHLHRAIGCFYIREGMRAAFIAYQHTVALTVVSCIGGIFTNLYLPSVTVTGYVCRNALGYNAGSRIFTYVNHFGSGIGLHMSVGESDRIKFAAGVISLQNTAGVFPCNCRSRLNLSPRNLRIITSTFSTFRYEIINTAFTCFFIACVPVLHGAVFNFSIVHSYQFHNSCM